MSYLMGCSCPAVGEKIRGRLVLGGWFGAIMV